MARGSCAFTQGDVTRALKGAKKAGVEILRIKIDKLGNIEINTGKPTTDKPDAEDKPTEEILL